MAVDYAQWDYQLGTFRAEVDGVVYGRFTGEFLHASDLLAAAGLPAELAPSLEAEKAAWESTRPAEEEKQID